MVPWAAIALGVVTYTVAAILLMYDIASARTMERAMSKPEEKRIVWGTIVVGLVCALIAAAMGYWLPLYVLISVTVVGQGIIEIKLRTADVSDELAHT